MDVNTLRVLPFPCSRNNRWPLSCLLADRWADSSVFNCL